jgi:translation elongation factor EF-Tu-like GTPase
VITGRVEQGVVKVGDNIELVGIQGTPTTTVVTGAQPSSSVAAAETQQPKPGWKCSVLLPAICRQTGGHMLLLLSCVGVPI